MLWGVRWGQGLLCVTESWRLRWPGLRCGAVLAAAGRRAVSGAVAFGVWGGVMDGLMTVGCGQVLQQGGGVLGLRHGNRLGAKNGRNSGGLQCCSC